MEIDGKIWQKILDERKLKDGKEMHARDWHLQDVWEFSSFRHKKDLDVLTFQMGLLMSVTM